MTPRRFPDDNPLPAFAASLDDLVARQNGLEIDRLPDGGMVVLPPRSGASMVASDPYLKKTLTQAVALYETREGTLYRTVTVRHEPEDRLWAQKLARLSGRLLRLHREKFGRAARFQGGGDEANVWFLREPHGGAGGETRGGHVYVYGTAGISSPLEWVRTLCHEWGHLTLPAARGFSDPETDAGGMLGERLHLGWLLGDKTPSPDDGARPADLALYVQRQCVPLIERFLAQGPASKTFARLDGKAMDLYVGAALATEKALGSALLGAALYSIDGVKPKDFFDALRNVVFLKRTFTVQLPAWAPLAPADYRLAPKEGRGALTIAGRPPVKVPGSLRPARPAFAKLTGTGTLVSVTLTRPGVRE